MKTENFQIHYLPCICLLWRIWKSRNKVVFEFTQPLATSLARQFFFQVQEYASVSSLPQILSPRPQPSRISSWLGPPDGFIKINFDAAVRVPGCSSGLVVRGSEGQVFLALGFHHPGVSDPYLAELMAARDAISLVHSRSLPLAIIEGDSEVVIRQLDGRCCEDSVGGPLLRDCFQLLSSCSSCIRFCSVPRTVNWAAHRVARQALLLSPVEIASFDFVGWLH
ncbi:unnamed protein product [Linum trigynum]|uniref:RNase H type-1 domain-containing protein n=1 Tax=Linum trigynum TaxID=586398 RepID=A0AAV2DCW2_9ROSI